MSKPGEDFEPYYLRADLLLPGDILLSRSPDAASAWIARLTRGPFSHAAVYLGSFLVFESLPNGIGLTEYAIARACAGKPGEGSIHLLDVSRFRRLEVFRHAEIAERIASAGNWYGVQDDLMKHLVPKNGADYPTASELAETVRWAPRWLSRLTLSLIAAIQKEPEKLVPGAFCSQLAADALRALGADPLKTPQSGKPLPSKAVSPNMLASSLSHLQRVNGAVVGKDFECTNENDPHRQILLGQLRGVQAQTLAMTDKQRAKETMVAVRNLERATEEALGALKPGKTDQSD